MTTLIVARHGNTFEDGEAPRRVGARTDLPLTDKGRAQAQAIGAWLKEKSLVPDVVYSSKLKRAIETAELAIRATGFRQPVYQLDIFNEIDYGPDENKAEDEVTARIGREAVAAWDNHGIVPPGWIADPAAIIQNWRGFAARVHEHDDNEVVLAVTSNGIARFALSLIPERERPVNAKLATGALGIFKYADGIWQLDQWNTRPQ